MDPGLVGDRGESLGEPPDNALSSDDRGEDDIASRSLTLLELFQSLPPRRAEA